MCAQCTRNMLGTILSAIHSPGKHQNIVKIAITQGNRRFFAAISKKWAQVAIFHFWLEFYTDVMSDDMNLIFFSAVDICSKVGMKIAGCQTDTCGMRYSSWRTIQAQNNPKISQIQLRAQLKNGPKWSFCIFGRNLIPTLCLTI